jgi:hypothetical protein
MPVYQIYKAKDGSEASTFQADTERNPKLERMLTHTVDDEPMELIATFYARGWAAAMKAKNTILGFDYFW